MKTKILLPIILITSIMLLIPIFSSPQLSPAFKLENEVQANFQGSGGSPYSMREDDTVGIHFSIGGDAVFVGVGCPSWVDDYGTLTFKLYNFNKDYKTSISQNPIIENTFTDFIDNSYLGFEFTKANPLLAGEYVLEISDAKDEIGFGVGIWTNQKYPGQNFFEDGVYNDSLSARMYIEFKDTTPSPPYGQLTQVKEEDAPINTDPYPYMGAIMKFSDPDAESFFSMSNSKYIDEITIKDGILKVPVLPGNDPQFTLVIQGPLDPVPCDDYPIILIRLKRPAGSPLRGEVFFDTSDFPGPVPGVLVGITYEDTTSWQDVIVDLSTNKNYTGDLLSLRYDIVNASESEYLFEIEHILFFGTIEAAQSFDMANLPTPEPTATPTPKVTAIPSTPIPTAYIAPEPTPKNKINPDIILGIIAGFLVLLAIVVVVLVKRKKASQSE